MKNVHAELARRAGVSPQFVSDLRARRKRASPDTAIRLEEAASGIGMDVTKEDWANPQWSKHPWFRGDPK